MTELDTLTDAWDRLTPGPAPVDAILRAHHARQQVRRRRRLATVGALAAVAVVATSLALQAQRTSPAPKPGAPVMSAPESTPAPPPSPAPTRTPTDDRSIVFFLLEGSGLPYVAVIPMRVRTDPREPAVRAVEAMLSEEPPREAGFAGSGNPWLDEEGRPEATLRSIDRDDGIVVVDLDTAAPSVRSPGLASWGAMAELPLLQVVCTAQVALDTTDPVRITVRGESVRLFGRDASRLRTCPAETLAMM